MLSLLPHGPHLYDLRIDTSNVYASPISQEIKNVLTKMFHKLMVAKEIFKSLGAFLPPLKVKIQYLNKSEKSQVVGKIH